MSADATFETTLPPVTRLLTVLLAGDNHYMDDGEIIYEHDKVVGLGPCRSKIDELHIRISCERMRTEQRRERLHKKQQRLKQRHEALVAKCRHTEVLSASSAQKENKEEPGSASTDTNYTHKLLDQIASLQALLKAKTLECKQLKEELDKMHLEKRVPLPPQDETITTQAIAAAQHQEHHHHSSSKRTTTTTTQQHHRLHQELYTTSVTTTVTEEHCMSSSSSSSAGAVLQEKHRHRPASPVPREEFTFHSTSPWTWNTQPYRTPSHPNIVSLPHFCLSFPSFSFPTSVAPALPCWSGYFGSRYGSASTHRACSGDVSLFPVKPKHTSWSSRRTLFGQPF